MRRAPRRSFDLSVAATAGAVPAKTDGRALPPPRPLEKTACAERARHALRGLLQIASSVRRSGSAETA
ncbi:MAG: hypothetical protein ACOY3L_15270 [Pseudomonadota bacterium]